MKNWWTLILAVVLLTACSSDDTTDSPTPAEPARRTVIVYMSAENDLNGFCEEDIQEMLNGRKYVAADESLVLFVDRASSMEKPFLAKVTTQGTLDTLYRYEQDFYATDPGMMADVLSRAITLCPALEDYGLVLWGHATSWMIESDSVATYNARRAYGRDTGTNVAGSGGKWMNIPSLRKCLEQIPVQWKFIFSDCCNMANVEVAYELRNVTDYLIGAPSEIPGVGAPYQTIVKDFFNHDDEQMYTKLCDDYHALIINRSLHTPIATIKTSGLKTLGEATRQVMAQVNAHIQSEEATTDIIYYYADKASIEADKTLYDMNDMIRTALKNDTESYEAWRKAYDQAVVYKKMSTRWQTDGTIPHVNFGDFTVTEEKFGGMSMFFPLAKYASRKHNYNEDIKKMGWYYAVGWSAFGW